jgi:hypothetical protein
MSENEWEKLSAKLWATYKSSQTKAKIGIKVPNSSAISFSGKRYEQGIRDQQSNTNPGIGQNLILGDYE